MTSEKHTKNNKNNNIYVPKTARARGQKQLCLKYSRFISDGIMGIGSVLNLSIGPFW